MSHAGRPGDRLIRLGVVLTLVGAVAAVVTTVPLFIDRDPFPTAVYLTAMLAPVGLGLAITGVVAQVRGRARAARASQSRPPDQR